GLTRYVAPQARPDAAVLPLLPVRCAEHSSQSANNRRNPNSVSLRSTPENVTRGGHSATARPATREAGAPSHLSARRITKGTVAAPAATCSANVIFIHVSEA